jgi:hypothetical protein
MPEFRKPVCTDNSTTAGRNNKTRRKKIKLHKTATRVVQNTNDKRTVEGKGNSSED